MDFKLTLADHERCPGHTCTAPPSIHYTHRCSRVVAPPPPSILALPGVPVCRHRYVHRQMRAREARTLAVSGGDKPRSGAGKDSHGSASTARAHTDDVAPAGGAGALQLRPGEQLKLRLPRSARPVPRRAGEVGGTAAGDAGDADLVRRHGVRLHAECCQRCTVRT